MVFKFLILLNSKWYLNSIFDHLKISSMLKKIMCILLVTNALYSQGNKGLYTYALTGYKLGSVYTSFPNEYSVNGNNISNAYIRLGGGNNVTGALGYMIHPNLGFEVSSTYTIGQTKKISDASGSSNNLEYIFKETQSNNLHSVGSIVAQAKLFNMTVYAKAGIVINYYATTKEDNQYRFGNNVNQSYGYRYQGNLMRGFNGSLGVLVPISKRMNLMIEAEEVSIQGHFTKGELFYNNTNSHLPNQIEFMGNISGKVSSSSIQYEKIYPVSYSCIGLNIGIHHSF
jgi:hypothetical protein